MSTQFSPANDLRTLTVPPAGRATPLSTYKASWLTTKADSGTPIHE